MVDIWRGIRSQAFLGKDEQTAFASHGADDHATFPLQPLVGLLWQAILVPIRIGHGLRVRISW
jgi:hypothetical protein